jgi:acetyltransferase-like isoleucine patch superfamily enzyme
VNSFSKIVVLLKILIIDTFKQILLLFTYLLPQGILSIKSRGYILKIFLGRSGKRFTVDSGVNILHPKNVIIGDDVYLARNVWINGSGRIKFGSNIMVGPMTIISSGDHVFRENKLTGDSVRAPIEIGSNTWIAGNATITKGVKIGSGVLVAAGAVVTKDIPDNVIVAGVPAKIIGENKGQIQRFFPN